VSEIVEKIAGETGRTGVIPFSRFMELALYCPDCGFYEKEKDNVGRRGDFFTSVSVGSLFGELLAFQFAEWAGAELKRERRGAGAGRVRLVEAGAHDGRLAGDVLRWLREYRKDAFSQIEYCIVEPSARRQEWQRKTLTEFGKTVRWVAEISALETARETPYTIIFSNELLDALPIRRLGWDATARKWFEWGVTMEAGRLVWSRMSIDVEHVSRFTFHISNFDKLLDILPDGFTTEVSPVAEKWCRNAAGVLKNGKLMTIDYGLSAEEFFTPERSAGTLRAYHRHHVSDDVLARPGEQDITAHVNFTAIQNAGETAGLKTDSFETQEKFLARIAEQTSQRADTFGKWNSARARQFQTLTHPEHLGRRFRVLIQSRQAGD
jgi:SAM-dependent MidA family methyltransferase